MVNIVGDNNRRPKSNFLCNDRVVVGVPHWRRDISPQVQPAKTGCVTTTTWLPASRGCAHCSMSSRRTWDALETYFWGKLPPTTPTAYACPVPAVVTRWQHRALLGRVTRPPVAGRQHRARLGRVTHPLVTRRQHRCPRSYSSAAWSYASKISLYTKCRRRAGGAGARLTPLDPSSARRKNSSSCPQRWPYYISNSPTIISRKSSTFPVRNRRALVSSVRDFFCLFKYRELWVF